MHNPTAGPQLQAVKYEYLNCCGCDGVVLITKNHPAPSYYCTVSTRAVLLVHRQTKTQTNRQHYRVSSL